MVLGMHRSGTSSVAGSLVGLGASAPSTLMPPMPDNPLGFWESDPVMHLNDAVLSSIGSDWRDWGAIDQPVLRGPSVKDFASAANALLDAEFGQARTIVLKDPRICRFYPFWRSVLQTAGFEPVVILPVRHPDQVARSLNTRNGLTIPHGLRLWLRHTLDAEYTSRSDTRQMTTLDEFISNWPQRFASLATISGVNLALADPVAVADINRFWAREILDSSMPSDGVALPELVDRTWLAFRTMSTDGDTPVSRALLDQVRGDFDALSGLFYEPPQAC